MGRRGDSDGDRDKASGSRKYDGGTEAKEGREVPTGFNDEVGGRLHQDSSGGLVLTEEVEG